MKVDPSLILEDLKMKMKGIREDNRKIAEVRRRFPEVERKWLAKNPDKTREDLLREMGDFEEAERFFGQFGKFIGEVLKKEAAWRWFDVGEFDKVHNVLDKEDMMRAGEEWIPYPNVFMTVHYFNEGANLDFRMVLLLIDTLKNPEFGWKGPSGDKPGILIASITQKNEGDWAVIREFVKIIKGDEGYWFVEYRDDKTDSYLTVDKDQWINEQDTLKTYCTLPVSCALTFMKILKCKNVYTQRDMFPAPLQKKRRKKGRVMGYDKHTLQIKNDGKDVNKDALGGTHASPRLHFRRGHIRRLTKGDIWVRETMVGSPHGFVEKTYQVEGETKDGISS